VYTCVDVRCEKSREKKRLPIGQSRDAGRDVGILSGEWLPAAHGQLEAIGVAYCGTGVVAPVPHRDFSSTTGIDRLMVFFPWYIKENTIAHCQFL
jgi:hypothetical protein